MKKFKISLLALLALFIGMVASSFTIHSFKKTTNGWFTYNGGSMTNPSNYSYQGTTPACSGSSTLCEINVADDGNGKPDQQALTSLYNGNNHFSQPVGGLIDFKP